ncbi:MAG: type VI secretion system tube protein Hcp [Desulfobacterales bacterium]|nr:type VI secretion system tube protein Hcp [Desulfobacterales bacterium]
MATDMFVQFSNLKGECEVPGLTDWCEITSLKQGFTNEAAPLPPGQTDKSNSRRGKHKAIEIEKVIDKASIGLMQACWKGRPVATVVIRCFRAGQGENGKQSINYFEIELENVIIKKFEYKVDEGNLASEELELVFSKASYVYKQMPKRGGTAIRAGTASIILKEGDHDERPNKARRREDEEEEAEDGSLLAQSPVTRSKL